MSDGTGIEWCDTTWNPLLGCERVSPGCDGCYAINTAVIRAGNPNPKVAAAFAGLAERRDGRLDWTGRINLLPDRLAQPMHWRKPRKIFVNSQSDLFHADVPEEYIAAVFAVMAVTPQHTYQLLTKRPARMRSLLTSHRWWTQFAIEFAERRPSGSSPVSYDAEGPHLRNLWLGVSVESQRWADIRIPALLDTPAAVRWLSMEPLIGPVNLHAHDDGLRHWLPDFGPEYDDGSGEPVCQAHGLSRCRQGCSYIDWVVVGGESGPTARPMHPTWARTLRDQCVAAGVPFFFKQWGAWAPYATHFAADREEQGAWDTYVNLDGTTGQFAISEDHDRATNYTGNLAEGNTAVSKVGKKAAGRLLDGATWDEYPPARTAVPA